MADSRSAAAVGKGFTSDFFCASCFVSALTGSVLLISGLGVSDLLCATGAGTTEGCVVATSAAIFSACVTGVVSAITSTFFLLEVLLVLFLGGFVFAIPWYSLQVPK